jgi:hypothetical protein
MGDRRYDALIEAARLPAPDQAEVLATLKAELARRKGTK